MRGWFVASCAVAGIWLACGTDYGDSSEAPSGDDSGADAAPPRQGEHFGACYPNGTCNEGLSCVDDLCVLVDAGLDLDAEDRDADAGTKKPDGAVDDADNGRCRAFPSLPLTSSVTCPFGQSCDAGSTCCFSGASAYVCVANPGACQGIPIGCETSAQCATGMCCAASVPAVDDAGCNVRNVTRSSCNTECSQAELPVCSVDDDCASKHCVFENIRIRTDLLSVGFCR